MIEIVATPIEPFSPCYECGSVPRNVSTCENPSDLRQCSRLWSVVCPGCGIHLPPVPMKEIACLKKAWNHFQKLGRERMAV